jgi:predicted small metal-binding protein
MNAILMCTECNYQAAGSSERGLMNKIIMWNHVQKVHPHVAERIMRIYNRVPDGIYDMRPVLKVAF